MSKRRLGDFADDPASIFVDVPPNPTWLVAMDTALSAAVVLGGYVAAKRLGASTTAAVAIAAVIGAAVGMKISLFARMRRIPRPSAEEFHRIRSAGSQALAAFRAAHPSLRQVGWSLVRADEASRVVVVSGNDGGNIVVASHTYAVDHDGSVREVDDRVYPRSSYSQRLERPGTTTR